MPITITDSNLRLKVLKGLVPLKDPLYKVKDLPYLGNMELNQDN